MAGDGGGGDAAGLLRDQAAGGEGGARHFLQSKQRLLLPRKEFRNDFRYRIIAKIFRHSQCCGVGASWSFLVGAGAGGKVWLHLR